jgi:ribosomal protein S18 acetylase RimI-like enzyme
MAAAWTHLQPRSKQREGLQPIKLSRDLYQIAELVETCFEERLDSSGRAAVREMKAMAQLGPLLWLFAPLSKYGFGTGLGYVWRDQNRVVGNVNLYRSGIHPTLGRGWLIANVAVHPDYRRRGIARKLMHAGLKLVRQHHARWVALQVEEDNQPALDLYNNLDFERFETLAQWESRHRSNFLPEPDEEWPVRRYQARDAQAEINLITRQVRQGGIVWGRPVDRSDLQPRPLSFFTEGYYRERWVMPVPALLPDSTHAARLLGSLWIEVPSWNRVRVSLFIDPALEQVEGRLALLLHFLHQSNYRSRVVRLETTAHDPPVESVLLEAGFRLKRKLVLMQLKMR